MAGPLDRPAALTPEVQRLIVQYLCEGNYLSVACRAAGTTPQTYNYWRRLCESGAEHAQVYADFFAACKRAFAVGEANAVREVVSGRPGWQGPAWFLGRRHPKRWAEKREAEKEPPVTYDKIDPDEHDVEPQRVDDAQEGMPE